MLTFTEFWFHLITLLVKRAETVIGKVLWKRFLKILLILWKKNCYLVYFLLKLRVRKLQLYEKWTSYLQVFFKDFVKNLSNATLDFKFPEHYLFFQSISKFKPLKVKIGASKTSLLVSLSSTINICIVTKYGIENYRIRSPKSFSLSKQFKTEGSFNFVNL